MFGPFLYIAVLSLFTVTGVTNMLVAQEKDTMQDTRCKILDNRTSVDVGWVKRTDCAK